MRIRSLTTLLALVVALTACSTADPASEATPSASPPSPPVTTATATEPSDRSTTAAAPVTGASLPAGHLLVAGPRGVDLVDPDGTSEPLTSIPAVAAYDDGAGGVVFQGTRPPGEDPPSAAIMWLPPDGGDAVTVVPDGLAEEVTLRDAGTAGGEPVAIVTVGVDRSSPQGSTQSLQSVSLPAGGRERVAIVGGFESGITSAVLGADTIALDRFDEAATWFDAVDLSGRQVQVAANPVTQGCQSGCPTAFSISADGAQVGWVDDAGALVIVDTEDPESTTTIDLGGYGPVADLRIVGGQAVLNRTNSDEPRPALLVDLATQATSTVTPAGHAALTRAG